MKKLILIGIVLLVILVGGGLAASWFSHRGAAAGAEATTVRVEIITRGDLAETVSAPGIIEPATKVSISAKVAAQILELPYKEGDQVYKESPTTQASVLVKLDSKNLEAALRVAQAQFSVQEAQIRGAEARVEAQNASMASLRIQVADALRDLNRQVQLLTSKDVSQSIVDQAQAKYDQLKSQIDASEQELLAQRANLQGSKHQLEAAEAEITRAKEDLRYTTIVAPIDGIVTRVNGKAGEIVVTGTMNNAGTVIMEVADLSRMILKARVDETSIASLKVGQKAIVRIPAYKDEEFEGVVQTVALANTEETRGAGMTYFKCEILINTKGRTIPSGLNADVDIETQRHINVIKVPSQAVLGRAVDEIPAALRNAPEIEVRKALTTVVYRVINGKATVTPVKIGASDLTHTEIISGLSEADRVITGPYKALEPLKDGQAVQEDSPATQPVRPPSSKPAKDV